MTEEDLKQNLFLLPTSEARKKRRTYIFLDQNWNFLEQFFHWNLLCPMLPGAQISHRTGGSPRADLPTPGLIEFAKDSLNEEMQLNPLI